MKSFIARIFLAAVLAVGMVHTVKAQQVPPANTVVTVRSAASTNATSTKAAAANLYGFSLCNKSAAVSYFKFYNKASAPTVGTDPVFFKIQIPIGQCRDRSTIQGWRFPLGLAWAITTLEPDTDATAVAAGDVTGTFDYK